jgi:hypothetical protein
MTDKPDKPIVRMGDIGVDSMTYALMHHTVREEKSVPILFDAIRRARSPTTRKDLLLALIAADVWTSYKTLLKHLSAAMLPVGDDTVYRIHLYTDHIEVLCFGIDSVDSTLEGEYHSTDDLPDWVKERLAVLMVMSSTPPTGDVAGVGRRISERVFWVYAPSADSDASTSA